MYSALKESLTNLFYSKDFNQIDQEMPTILACFRDPDYLTSLLEEIALRTDDITKLCKSSYYHPNGFLKLMLMECKHTGFLMRLHSWDNQSSEKELISRTHNHMRDGWSIILDGEMCDNRYFECPSKFGEKYFKTNIYERHDTSSYKLVPVGNTYLTQKSSQKLHKGNIYSLFHRAIHNTVIPSKMKASTIFIQSCRLSSHSSSFTTTQRGELTNSKHLSEHNYLQMLKSKENIL